MKNLSDTTVNARRDILDSEETALDAHLTADTAARPKLANVTTIKFGTWKPTPASQLAVNTKFTLLMDVNAKTDTKESMENAKRKKFTSTQSTITNLMIPITDTEADIVERTKELLPEEDATANTDSLDTTERTVRNAQKTDIGMSTLTTVKVPAFATSLSRWLITNVSQIVARTSDSPLEEDVIASLALPDMMVLTVKDAP